MKKMHGSLPRAALLLSLLLLLAALLLTGCEVAPTETKSFSVKYLDASGAVLKTEEVQRGGLATPPDVSHSADTQVVWLTESGNRFDFTFAIDRDWTLRASFVTREYLLSVEGTNAAVTVTDKDGHRLTDTVKHGDVITVTATSNENAKDLTVTVNGTAEAVTGDRFTKTYTVEGDMTISASASVIRYPITVTADEHVILTLAGGDGGALADETAVEALTSLRITARAGEGYILRAISVTMGDTAVTAVDGVFTIGRVTGAVVITAETGRERTVSGTVAVWDPAFDPAKFSVTQNGYALDATCGADGSYTIRGLACEDAELILNYAGYYSQSVTLAADDGYTIEGCDATFCYRMIENYVNGEGYQYGTIGDTTKDFTLGWAHNARFKDLRLAVTDTSDFALMTTLAKLDKSGVIAGVSLDIYAADGSLSRNIAFAYDLTTQSLQIATFTKRGDAYKVTMTIPMGLSLVCPTGAADTAMHVALLRHGGQYYFAVGQNGDGSYSKLFAIDAGLIALQSDETQMGFGVSESGQQSTTAKDVLFRYGTEATTYAGTALGLGNTYDVAVNAPTGATVTIKDAADATYVSGGTVAGGKSLTVTVSVTDGYAVKAFTVKVGDQTFTVTENTFTIGLVKGDVEVTVIVEVERTVSGTVTVTGGVTLDPTKLSTNVGSITCNADGTFTIRGIGSEVTELTLSYTDYYAEKLAIGSDATVTGKNVAFRYRVMENYKNALNYNSTPLGDVAKSFKLGWGHSARMKGLYLPTSDTRDFVVQTVVRQFGDDPSKDGSYTSAGISLDLYKADGTLSRNLTFRYKQSSQTLIIVTFGGETYRKEITTELTLPKPIGTDATAWNIALMRVGGSYYFAIGTVSGGTYNVIPVDLSDFTIDATETQMGFGVVESDDQHAYFTDCALLVGTEATTFAVGKLPTTEEE